MVGMRIVPLSSDALDALSGRMLQETRHARGAETRGPEAAGASRRRYCATIASIGWRLHWNEC
jgi:hypothetical protein